MALCELCGKDDFLVPAVVEGASLHVCSPCSKYGVVRREVLTKPSRLVSHSPLPEFMVVQNFPILLRSAREASGLNQEDFARFLQERASVVAKWEQGVLKPSVEAAKRIGRILGQQFLIKEEASASVVEKTMKPRSTDFTLGDFVKIRKRL